MGVRSACVAGLAVCSFLSGPDRAAAFGDQAGVEIVSLDRNTDDQDAVSVTGRLSWEVRKRTSVEPMLEPGKARLSDDSVFRSPMLYWRGDAEFAPLSEAEVEALRRYVNRGGFIIIDDASAGGEGFDRSVRRELQRAFPASPLKPIPDDHTIFRSFYLLGRPVGRVEGPAFLEGVSRGDRIAVVYSRHDLGGALRRDRLGSWTQAVVPGGERQRERAIRLAVNLVLYSLCTDYKDDQVHAPFIMRRRGSGP